MALKKIGALLSLDGESDFKKAASNINTTLKTLKSEMKLVTSEFNGNANSMQALTAKGEVLNKQFETQTKKVDTLSEAHQNAVKNQKKISDAVEEYKLRLKDAEVRMTELSASSDATNEELEEQAKVVNTLKTDLGMAEKAYANATKSTELWQFKLNEAKVDLNNLNADIQQNDKYLNEARQSFNGVATSVDEFGNSVELAGDKSLSTGDIIKANLISDVIIEGFQMLGRAVKDVATEITTVGMEFESAFAGVQKTVTATEEEMGNLREGIIELSGEIPSSAAEISAVAEAAGQLGIQTDNIMSFTQTMIDLGNSTNVSAEDAASSLAQFANIVSMNQDNFSNLGSTIVRLGNNFATTEADIINMATRLAAAGTQVNMSEADIMGLATALSSVGLEAEAGGSAFSKAMVNIQLAVETGSAELNNYAEVAGMSADEFARAWRYDATGALSAFITGLGDTSRLGTSTIAILDEMGLSEVRLRDALLRASSSSELFNEAIRMGNEAWEENNALTQEAAQRYETAESKTEILKNSVDALCISAYDKFRNSFVKGVESATEGVGDLTESVESGRLGNSIENLGESVADFTDEAIELGEKVLPVVVDGLAWIMDNAKPIAAGITGIVSAMAAYKGVQMVNAGVDAYKKLKVTIETATTAQAALNAVQKAGLVTNPYGLMAAAAVGLGAALVTLISTAKDHTEEMREYADSLADVRKEMAAYAEQVEKDIKNREKSIESLSGTSTALNDITTSLFELSDKEQKSTAEKEKMKLIVDELNESVEGLNLTLDEETGALNMSQEAVRQSINTMMDYKKAELIMDNAAETAVELAEAEYELEEANKVLTKTTDDVSAAEKKYKEALEKLTKAQEAGIYTTTKEEMAVSAAVDEYLIMTQAQEEAKGTVDELSKAVEALTGDYNKYMGMLGEKNTAEEEATTVTVSFGDKTMQVSQSVAQSMNSLQQSYEATKVKLAESIDSQVGLFDKLAVNSEMSIDEMITNLESQQYAMSQWANNVKIAAERGVDEGLIAALNDGSVESAQILNEIVNSSDEKIQELNEAYSGASEAKEVLTDAMADVKEGYTESMNEMIEEAGEVATTGSIKNGEAIAEGTATGINNKKPNLLETMRTLAQDVLGIFGGELEIRSPSRKMTRLSEYVPEGAAIGIQNKAYLATQAVENMADEMTDAFHPQLVADNIIPGEKMYSVSSGSVVDNSSRKVDVYIQPQNMSETELERCFNYINRRFGIA